MPEAASRPAPTTATNLPKFVLIKQAWNSRNLVGFTVRWIWVQTLVPFVSRLGKQLSSEPQFTYLFTLE